MTGISKIIKEKTKVWTPGLLVDLIRRSVQVEPAGRQEVHRMTEKHKTRTQIKQDEIPQTNKPGTSQGYYLFMEDDAGCMIEQQSGQAIRDTDTEQHLPTHLITDAEAATYQVPE